MGEGGGSDFNATTAGYAATRLVDDGLSLSRSHQAPARTFSRLAVPARGHWAQTLWAARVPGAA